MNRIKINLIFLTLIAVCFALDWQLGTLSGVVLGAIGTQTLVTGSRTTLNTGSTNLKVRDVEDKIALLKPYQTPIDDFFISTSMANKVTTGERTKFEWYEDTFLPDMTTIGAGGIDGGAATEAAVVVANDYFLVNDTILVENTGQMVIVTAVATGTIDIASHNGDNITADVQGGRLQRLIPAFKEVSSKQSAKTVLAVQKTGYCQIMKFALSMTGRQQAAKQYGGDDWDFQWGKVLEQARESMERYWLQAGAAYDEGGTSGRTYSMGFGSLTTNLVGYSGSLDKTEWDGGIQQIAESGDSNLLMAYAGGDALSDINAFIDTRWDITQSGASMLLEQFGITTASGKKKPQFVVYQHPMCKVIVCWEPQLKGPNYGSRVLVVDPTRVKKRFCAPDKKGPRKYRVERGIETPGDDSFDAQYLFDQGLQIQIEEAHGWFVKN